MKVISTVIAFVVAAAAAAASGVRGVGVEPPQFSSYSTQVAVHSDELGIHSTQVLNTYWQVDGSQDRVAITRVKGASVPAKQVFDYSQQKVWVMNEGGTCEYYCKLPKSSSACFDQQTSLCIPDKRATETANVTINGRPANQYSWKQKFIVTFSETWLYVDAERNTPLEQDVHETPGGKPLGWTNMTYTNFNGTTPAASIFVVPEVSDCHLGSSSQCQAYPEDQANDTF